MGIRTPPDLNTVTPNLRTFRIGLRLYVKFVNSLYSSSLPASTPR